MANQVARNLQKLVDIKKDIKSALEEKGRKPTNDFSTYANEIRDLIKGEIAITSTESVDVAHYEIAKVVDENLISENIAKNKTILGITGTFSDLDNFIDGSRSMVEITSDRTNIREYAFYYCDELTNINLPNANTIGSFAFYGCSKLININLPNVNNIGGNIFNDCSNLTSVDLPNLTNINVHTFRYCYRLTNIHIPLATNIRSNAFFYCSSLKEVLIEQTDSVCALSSTDAFDYCFHILGTTNSTYNPNGLKDGYIYVPHTLLTQYKVATNWVQFKSQIIGHGDFNAGENFQNYADGTTYTSCMWYSDKELTTLVGGWSVAEANVGSAPTGTTSAPTTGRYYCKLD